MVVVEFTDGRKPVEFHDPEAFIQHLGDGHCSVVTQGETYWFDNVEVGNRTHIIANSIRIINPGMPSIILGKV